MVWALETARVCLVIFGCAAAGAQSHRARWASPSAADQPAECTKTLT
jgi:hypothetical protein